MFTFYNGDVELHIGGTDPSPDDVSLYFSLYKVTSTSFENTCTMTIGRVNNSGGSRYIAWQKAATRTSTSSKWCFYPNGVYLQDN